MEHYLSKGDDGTAVVRVHRRLKYLPHAQAGIIDSLPGIQILISYRTPVAKIDFNGWLSIWLTYSPTTMHHIKAFLRENDTQLSRETIKYLCANEMAYNIYTGELKDL